LGILFNTGILFENEVKCLGGESHEVIDQHVTTAEQKDRHHGTKSKSFNTLDVISDKAIPLQTEGIKRTPPLLELGQSFFGPGPIPPGFKIPTGAMWQPRLTVFGQLRSAIQSFDDGRTRTISEWVSRLDLFAEARLTGTERFLFGMFALSQDDRFTGYNFEPDGKWKSATEGDLEIAFFEGEIGEIFPNLDPQDRKPLDIQFSVGRQPIIYQDGMLINDRFDSIGVAKDNIYVPGNGNMKLTALYGFNKINRNDNHQDSDANLYGLFSKTDFYKRTVDVDLVYVTSNSRKEDGIVAAISSIQRIGQISTTIRALTSQSFGDNTPQISDGTLLFFEGSWTPPRTADLIYCDLYWAIDSFSSAARAPEVGGSLGRTGILHEAVGLGNYGSALINTAEEAVGVSIGYQKFFGYHKGKFYEPKRKQLILELGVREGTDGNSDESAIALGTRYQQAFGRRTVIRFDAFGALQNDNDQAWGGRLEFVINF
jgi:hypothetical protein